MKIITKTAIFFLGVAIVVAPSVAFAQLSGGGSSTSGTSLSGGGSSATNSSGANLSGGSSSASNSASADLSGGGSSAPSNPGADLSGGGASTVPASTPNPSNPGNTGGSSVGGSSGGSSGGGSSSGLSGRRRDISGLLGVTSPAGTSGTSCFLSSYLKAGDTGAEVTKLQNFLKNREIDVNVTGVYDAQTIVAVMNFQTQYASEVLAPWGVSTPTGNVYMTTFKKINSLACNTPMTLTPAELAALNAAKAAVDAGFVPAAEVIGSAPSISGSVVAVGSTSVETNGTTSETQTAAASKSPILSKIWNFIKRIFGR